MKKVFTFGETMMRLTTSRYARFFQTTQFDLHFAGGESNVAASLARLKIAAAHVTRLPDNDLGEALIESFKKTGIDTNYILKGGGRLGTFYVENGASIRAGKVIYDREHSSFATLNPEEFQWDNILKDANWFHFTGITPAISERAAIACLNAVKTAKRLGITVSADVGYRSNLWKWGKKPRDIMPELVENSSIIVCSVHDAADMFGIYPNPEEDAFTSISKQIMARFPAIKTIITTERGQVSASYNILQGKCYNGTSLLTTETIDIPNIVDRIGGGDAFMAGFIYGKITFEDDLKALKFGVAASALKHTIEGDINLVTAQEIETVMNGDTSGRLKR